MLPIFSEEKKTVVITGANGWVGRNAYVALHHKYNLILVDSCIGNDPYNRFGIEKADTSFIQIPEQSIVKINLITEKEKFAELIINHKPSCVIHLAGVLENQEVNDIMKNEIINQNVLDVCSQQSVKIIATSSIMVMYGLAMRNDKIRKILRNENILLEPSEKLSEDAPLDNTESNIKEFTSVAWRKNLAYIKTKESLERYAQKVATNNPNLTVTLIRLGWTGIKNPYELESDVKYSETTMYLAQIDLQNFLRKITKATITGKIDGYRCYIAVSKHPRSWVNTENSKIDLDWAPLINIEDAYSIHPKCEYIYKNVK